MTISTKPNRIKNELNTTKIHLLMHADVNITSDRHKIEIVIMWF